AESHWNPHRWLRFGQGRPRLLPEMDECVRGPVTDIPDAQVGCDSFTQVRVDRTNRILAVQSGEAVMLGKVHEFLAKHRLIENERIVEIVGQMKVAARFPEADRRRFLKLALESDLRTDIQEKG